MAENFIWYATFTDTLELLDDAMKFELFNAILTYGSKCEEPEFSSSLMKAMFVSIKTDIDYAKERYEEAIENGRKGGRHYKLTEDQKQQVIELLESGMTIEKVANTVGCSTSTVNRIKMSKYQNHHFDRHVNVSKCQNLKDMTILNGQNLYKDIDKDIYKDIDIDIDIESDIDTDTTADAVHDNANTQPTDSDLISTATSMGYTIDEDTASRISGYCDSVGITEKGQWFKFCMCKAAEKGLLNGKDKEQCKRIVVSAAINSKDKWSYLTDDFPQWLERKKPTKAWSSGITLPPVEECATDAEVAQVFSSLRFKTPAE